MKEIPCEKCPTLAICVSRVNRSAKDYEILMSISEKTRWEVAVRNLLSKYKCTLLESYMLETNGYSCDFRALIPHLKG